MPKVLGAEAPHPRMRSENDGRKRPSKKKTENDGRAYSFSHLVQQILLGDEVLLEHVLVEVVGRADAPLHAAAGHLHVAQEKRGAPDWPKASQRFSGRGAFGCRSHTVKACWR